MDDPDGTNPRKQDTAFVITISLDIPWLLRTSWRVLITANLVSFVIAPVVLTVIANRPISDVPGVIAEIVCIILPTCGDDRPPPTSQPLTPTPSPTPQPTDLPRPTATSQATFIAPKCDDSHWSKFTFIGQRGVVIVDKVIQRHPSLYHETGYRLGNGLKFELLDVPRCAILPTYAASMLYLYVRFDNGNVGYIAESGRDRNKVIQYNVWPL